MAPTLTAHNNRVFIGWTGTDNHLNVAALTTNLGTVTSPLQTFPVVNGTLTVHGDQIGANFNDVIFIERAPGGGVKVTLNGQMAQFAPGAITAIVVNTEGGTNTINVQADFAEAPITINGGGTDRLAFFGTPPSPPVYTPGANGLPADGRLNIGSLVINFTGLELVEGVAPRVSGVQLSAASIDENGVVTVNGSFADPARLPPIRL